MFPWLPFLSLHDGDPNRKPRRKRRPNSRKHSSLTSVWLNVECEDGINTVRVEYLPVPFQSPRYTATASSSTDLGFGSTTATVTSETRADSAPIGDVVPQRQPQQPSKKRSTLQRPETPTRSPRSTSANNSRPGSANAQLPPTAPVINAPPPRTNRRGRMFETSSAMLEIFGSVSNTTHVPQEQPKNSQKEKNSDSLNAALASTAVYEGSATIGRPTEPFQTETSQPTTSQIHQNAQIQSASVTFQQIPPTPPTDPNDRPHFGRTNALAREGVSRTEWEPITTSATTSMHQTIADHDSDYERARHRGNWEGAQSSFNVLNQYTQREASPMRQQNEVTANCPAENEIRRRQRSGQLENENAIEEQTMVRDPSLECPIDVVTQPIQNGHTSMETQRKREGVADLFSNGENAFQWERASQCAFKAADAAGEPSTSYRRPNGVSFENGKEADLAHSSPQKPNGSSQPDQNSTQLPESADRKNGTNLNGNLVEEKQVEQKRRRFILSLAEDGSGMVASGGSGAGCDSSTSPILIKNAQIVNDDAIFAADVLIADGQIKQILTGVEAPEGAEIIDAAGRWLLPAGIDLHCELGNVEDLANASKDALSGGTTTIVNVVKTSNDNESLLTAFDRARSSIDSKADCNVALSVQLQKWSSDIKSQVEELCQKRGVNSFILDIQSDAEIFEAMEQLKKFGVLSRILPENKDIVALLEKQFASLQSSEAYLKARPAPLEAERIHRICVLAQLTNAPFSVLSVGSSEACRAIQSGRQQGALVSAEVPISALATDSISHSAPQSRIPIRSGGNNSHDALELLANGPLSVCVSDHSSIRRNKLPIGTLAIGDRMSVLWEKAVTSGKIDLMRFVAVSSTNGAKLFNLYPKKGRIAVGADADLVIWNAQSSHRISSRNQNEKNHFDGLTVSASPELTICAGRIVYRNGKSTTVEKSAESRFVGLQPNAPHVFSVVQLREKTLSLIKPPAPIAAQRKDSAVSNGSSGGDRPASRDRGNTPQDNQPEKQRPITKVIHPPGGRSTGFW